MTYDLEMRPGADRLEASSSLDGAPLLLRTGDSGWRVPATTTWRNEATLRGILTAHPTVIPGVTDPRAAAVAELHIPQTGFVDVVAVEPDGSITICEAKLSTNPEMRRTIVGQVLAYAAGLSRMTVEAFEQSWASCSQGQSFVSHVLGDEDSEADAAELRSAVATNLAEGRFRLILAVDALTDELRQVVEYLALHSDIEVAALELAYAEHAGVEVLIPRSWGSQLSSESRRRHGNRRPTGRHMPLGDIRAAVVSDAEAAAEGAGKLVEALIDRIGHRVAKAYLGPNAPTDPVLVVETPVRCQPLKLITSKGSPGVRFCFSWCQRLPADRLDAALARLESHPALAPHVEGVRGADFRKRPLLPFIGGVDQDGAIDALAEAFEQLFQ